MWSDGAVNRLCEDAVADLICPHCRSRGSEMPLAPVPDGSDREPPTIVRTVGCAVGHRFDRARQGYLNLLGPQRPATTGDTAGMVAARSAVFASGAFAPLARTLAHLAADLPADGCVLDAGAGPGYYLATLLDLLPGRRGIACDVSVPACRRAAKAHPGACAVVADVWAGLPVRTGAAGILLNVFAPRNVDEFTRVLSPSGHLVVVTPGPFHLAGLVAELGLLSVPENKSERTSTILRQRFSLLDRQELSWSLELTPQQATAIVGMGPSAHHIDPATLEAGLRGRPTWDVEADVELAVYQRD